MQSAPPQTNLVPAFQPSPRLQTIVDHAVQQTRAQFAPLHLQAEQLAITLVDLRNPNRPERACYRGTERIYPASVVKSFYLMATHRWMEDGKLADTEELRRAMRDMIVDSFNEPTGYVLDLLTGTTSGPELSPAEFNAWFEKRNAVNRYFASLGYENINLNRKTWCEGPYGREKQLAGQPPPDHRNWLTTDATARLFTEIVTGRAVTPERSRQMLALHERQPFDPEGNGQSHEYTGAVLPPGSKLWSKAGWMSEVRHDAAYVELPTGEKFILVTSPSATQRIKRSFPPWRKRSLKACKRGNDGSALTKPAEKNHGDAKHQRPRRERKEKFQDELIARFHVARHFKSTTCPCALWLESTARSSSFIPPDRVVA